jgi:hypothetical protein
MVRMMTMLGRMAVVELDQVKSKQAFVLAMDWTTMDHPLLTIGIS